MESRRARLRQPARRQRPARTRGQVVRAAARATNPAREQPHRRRRRSAAAERPSRVSRRRPGRRVRTRCATPSAARSDPLGEYYRYEFLRPLFPDYPRPAVWPDGYYVPTSTGDEVIEKHACVVDRQRMLRGEPATEQCVIINDVNFLNNADLDGKRLPPAGAPNVMMAAGGTQLKDDLDDDGIYAWNFHVDWKTPANTRSPARSRSRSRRITISATAS